MQNQLPINCHPSPAIRDSRVSFGLNMTNTYQIKVMMLLILFQVESHLNVKYIHTVQLYYVE